MPRVTKSNISGPVSVAYGGSVKGAYDLFVPQAQSTPKKAQHPYKKRQPLGEITYINQNCCQRRMRPSEKAKRCFASPNPPTLSAAQGNHPAHTGLIFPTKPGELAIPNPEPYLAAWSASFGPVRYGTTFRIVERNDKNILCACTPWDGGPYKFCQFCSGGRSSVPQ